MSKFRNFAVAVITLISTANTLGFSYLSQRHIREETANYNESVDATEVQEYISPSVESTSEDNYSLNETTTEQPVFASDMTDDTADHESVSVESIETTEMQQSIPTEKYEINSIAKLNNGDINSFQSYAIDSDDNAIYFLDRNLEAYYERVVYYIYKYDIQSKTVELIKELPYSTNLYPISLTYNQYNNKVYCFAGGGEFTNEFAYFQVESNEFHQLNTNGNRNFLSHYNHFDDADYRSFYFISENEFVIGCTDFSILYLYNDMDDSFNSGTIGVPSPNQKDETDTPFMYNENYYWLCTRSNGFSINKTQKLFYPRNESEYYGDMLKQFQTSEGWIAANVYNNDVYLMNSNYSIYKVDLEALEQLYNENNHTEENNNLIITPDTDDDANKALSLYIDGTEIKQTGINNLTDIKYFNFTSDGSILVYDDFDKNYKLLTRK